MLEIIAPAVGDRLAKTVADPMIATAIAGTRAWLRIRRRRRRAHDDEALQKLGIGQAVFRCAFGAARSARAMAGLSKRACGLVIAGAGRLPGPARWDNTTR